MKIKILIMLLSLTFVFLSSIVVAETMKIGENTFNITPLINNSSCNNTTKVFLIQRENYQIGMETVTINYKQKWDEQTNNITKTFKKYTSAKTGNIENITSGNHQLKFINGNKTLTWNFNINCLNINTTINQTTNATNNTINNTGYNNSNSTNNNQTTNSTINNTFYNNTNNTTYVNQTTNTTITNNNSNQSFNESKNIINIQINKYFFKVGEKIKFRFINNTEPVTYWIEDTKGKTIKEKYTTTNSNWKTYTFKTQENEDKIYFLKIKKGQINKTITLGVWQPNTIKSAIKITDSQYTNNHIKTTINIYRGEVLKNTVTCNTITNKQRSSEEIKIKLLTKNSQSSNIMIFYPTRKWDSKTTIKCEGLNINEQTQIETKKEIKGELIKTYTKEKYYHENLSWNVRAKCEDKGVIIVKSEKDKQEKTLEANKEQTINFVIKNIQSQDIIKTILLCGNKTYERKDAITLKNKSQTNNNKEEKQTDLTSKKQNLTNIIKITNDKKTIEKKEIPSITGYLSAESLEKEKEKRISITIVVGLLLSLLGVLIGYGPKRVIDKFIKK